MISETIKAIVDSLDRGCVVEFHPHMESDVKAIVKNAGNSADFTFDGISLDYHYADKSVATEIRKATDQVCQFRR